jgi:hypothetical protein
MNFRYSIQIDLSLKAQTFHRSVAQLDLDHFQVLHHTCEPVQPIDPLQREASTMMQGSLGPLKDSLDHQELDHLAEDRFQVRPKSEEW